MFYATYNSTILVVSLDLSATILHVLTGFTELILVYYAWRIAQKTGYGLRGKLYCIGFALISVGRFIIAVADFNSGYLEYLSDIGLLLILAATIIVTLGFRQFLGVVRKMMAGNKNG